MSDWKREAAAVRNERRGPAPDRERARSRRGAKRWIVYAIWPFPTVKDPARALYRAGRYEREEDAIKGRAGYIKSMTHTYPDGTTVTAEAWVVYE